jgi:peptide/nickel transport system substrate-binding protein
MGFASIYSAEYADKLLKAGTTDKLNSQPIGTGPFVFTRFQKDASVRYKANPDYFGGKPSVDPLIFAITPDANVRLQKLRRNECQIALSPKPLDVQAALKEPTLKVEKTDAFMTAFVGINSQHPPLDKPEVRQAINLAFDKANYVKAVFEDTAEAANGPYPPNTWSYAKNLPGYPHDIAKAKALLARPDSRTASDHHLDAPFRQSAEPQPEPRRAAAIGPGGNRHSGRDPRDRVGRTDPPRQGWRA